jgi:hypothetical protein
VGERPRQGCVAHVARKGRASAQGAGWRLPPQSGSAPHWMPVARMRWRKSTGRTFGQHHTNSWKRCHGVGIPLWHFSVDPRMVTTLFGGMLLILHLMWPRLSLCLCCFAPARSHWYSPMARRTPNGSKRPQQKVRPRRRSHHQRKGQLLQPSLRNLPRMRKGQLPQPSLQQPPRKMYGREAPNGLRHA